jgi:hypothetical protein
MHDEIVGDYTVVAQAGRAVVLNRSGYPVADFLTWSEAVECATSENGKDDTPLSFG